MTLWIDLEDASGNRLGSGPITTALNWSYERQLDRAGNFSFTLPANDAQALEVQARRTVRFYAYVAGALEEYGRGIITSVIYSNDASGQQVLQVSGSDLLLELTDTLIASAQFRQLEQVHPAAVWYYYIPFGFYPAWGTYDYAVGDTTTYHDIGELKGPANDNYLYICDNQQFESVSFVFHTPNASGTNAHWEYYDGVSWQNLTKLADTTLSGGVPLGQDGYIRFTIPSDWRPQAGSYRIRIWIDTANATLIHDISVWRYGPVATALSGGTAGCSVDDYFPVGWTFDAVDGYTTTAIEETVGSNLLLNPGFEVGGTGGDFDGGAEVDDATVDAFTSWTDTSAGDGYAEATATHYAGDYAVKMHALASTPWEPAKLEQAVTVTESSLYRLTIRHRGDGTFGGYSVVRDVTHTTGTFPDDNDIRGFSDYAPAATFASVEEYLRIPVGCTSIAVTLRAPYIAGTGYGIFDGLELYKIVRDGYVMLEVKNETPLEVLIRLTETTGQHFIAHPTLRQVRWLQNQAAASGIRARAYTDANASETQDDLALIVSLTEEQDATSLCSRVYPFGSGFGATRATLADCTRSAPSGYTLDKTNNYLKRDASETNIAQVDRILDIPDAEDLAVGAEYKTYTSNTLFDRALNYLETHSATDTNRLTGDMPKLYSITLAKCRTILLPGQTLRVDYQEYNDAGALVCDVAADLRIMSATTTYSADGISTVQVKVANVAAWPSSDAEFITRELRLWRQQRSREA